MEGNNLFPRILVQKQNPNLVLSEVSSVPEMWISEQDRYIFKLIWRSGEPVNFCCARTSIDRGEDQLTFSEEIIRACHLSYVGVKSTSTHLDMTGRCLRTGAGTLTTVCTVLWCVAVRNVKTWPKSTCSTLVYRAYSFFPFFFLINFDIRYTLRCEMCKSYPETL